MTIRIDPEGNEISALVDLVNVAGKQVLEVGSGDGRLTWRYAEAAAHVTAIEPFEEAFRRALKNRPFGLRDQVELVQIEFADFAAACTPETYDLAILSWSL